MKKIPTDQEIRYEIARKRVKKIKEFYTHLAVYICVNIFIIFINISDLKQGESYFQPKNFMTAFFWGIGLVAHALSVFGRSEEHTSELQSRPHLVCRLLLEKKKKN